MNINKLILESVKDGVLIAKMSHSYNVNDFIEYLKNTTKYNYFSRIETYSKSNIKEHVIYCEDNISDEERQAIINKLKLTNVKFVDKFNRMYNS